MASKTRTQITRFRKRFRSKIRVLGLDCSSSVIGWGLLSPANNKLHLMAYGHIKPLDSKHNLFVRLEDVWSQIGELCEQTKPTHIVIEDILLHMKGKSSAKTITTLAIFNRVAGLSAFTYTNIEPKLLPVSTIRKYIRKEYSNIDPKFKKEDIPDIIREYLEPKFGDIINRNNKISPITYDQADGIIAAWAYSIYLGQKDE